MSKELNRLTEIEKAAKDAQQAYERAYANYDNLIQTHARLQADVPARQQELSNLEHDIASIDPYVEEQRDWLRNNAGQQPHLSHNAAAKIAAAESFKRELTLALPAHQERLKKAQDALAAFVAKHPKIELPAEPTPSSRLAAMNAATAGKL